jgi:hypothetical protein
MSKPSYQAADACKDTRTAKGSIMSFFAPKAASSKSPAGKGGIVGGSSNGGDGPQSPVAPQAASGAAAGGSPQAAVRGAGASPPAPAGDVSAAGVKFKAEGAAASTSAAVAAAAGEVRNSDENAGPGEAAVIKQEHAAEKREGPAVIQEAAVAVGHSHEAGVKRAAAGEDGSGGDGGGASKKARA